MTQTAEILLRINVRQDGTADLATIAAAIAQSYQVSMASGTSSGKADMVWSDTRTTDDTGEDLDLAGSLTGHLGGTLTFAKIKLVVVVAAAANTLNVQVTRPSSNGVPLFLAAGDGIAVGPGGFAAWTSPAAGVAVTAGTGDLLHVAASASGSVTYDIYIIGTSA